MYRPISLLCIPLMYYMLVHVLGKDQIRILDCYGCSSRYDNRSMYLRVKDCEQSSPNKSYLKLGKPQNKSMLCHASVEVDNRGWRGIEYSLQRGSLPEEYYTKYSRPFPKNGDEGAVCFQMRSLNISQEGNWYLKSCSCVSNGCNGEFSMDKLLNMKMKMINETKL